MNVGVPAGSSCRSFESAPIVPRSARPPRGLEKNFLCLWRARTQGLLMAFTVERLHQIFLRTDLLPVQSASEFQVLLTQFEQVLVELDCIDCYPPLLGTQFLRPQGVF